MILITGGCGFIGAHLIRRWLASHDEGVVNLDALTYAARPEALSDLEHDPRYVFVHGDVRDRELVDGLLDRYRPRAILNLAAESHVDRSIADATAFEATNTGGTLVLLQASLAWLRQAPGDQARAFRFLQCSTDEVFGALRPDDPPCDEEAAYRPRNPYSASKAAADHFVMAFHETFGLPTLITRGTNTYGPGQHPEKLIPLALQRLLSGQPVPLYGDGLAERDWLYVHDHCDGLLAVLARGRPGHSYNISGHRPEKNVDLVKSLIRLCSELDVLPKVPADQLITYVADRPGHDRRYALDDSKLRREIGWAPKITLEAGLRQTVGDAIKTASVKGGAGKHGLPQGDQARTARACDVRS